MNIIITGASRGIGFELAKQLCSIKGNKVIAIAREIKSIQYLSGKLTVGKDESFLYPLAADLNKKGFEKSMLEYVLDRFKKIDILINNAGALINKPLQQFTPDDFDYLFSVNTKAPFLIIQTLLPYFNNPSHIVNISSMGGYQGSEKFPGLSLYSASKGALVILSECLAVELKGKGISVNCLALGSAQTEMFSEAFPGIKAQTTAEEMARYIVDFSLNGYKNQSGKIIPVTKMNP
jgi:NAD(P)-dependent dehydrogenase (short-subunit alcohol dehydrogenase family)